MIQRKPEWWNGRHGGLKIRCSQGRVGSTPTSGTTFDQHLRHAPAIAASSAQQACDTYDAGVSDGAVRGPVLTGEHSDLGRRFYEALQRSVQAQWYEDSDWATAELLVAAIDDCVKRPSAAMFAAINVGMRGLLVTVADRRRARGQKPGYPTGATGCGPSTGEHSTSAGGSRGCRFCRRSARTATGDGELPRAAIDDW